MGGLLGLVIAKKIVAAEYAAGLTERKAKKWG
jgi:hypothetical protein